MRRLVIIAALVFGLGQSASNAQDDDAGIRSVISRQIEAFRVDDFETAFSFASPAIKRLFGNPKRFGEMVQSGYPMVWRPADVRFSGIDTRDGRTFQSVLVTDQGGALFVLEYEMTPADGKWMINGVTVRRPGDAGA